VLVNIFDRETPVELGSTSREGLSRRRRVESRRHVERAISRAIVPHGPLPPNVNVWDATADGP